MELAELRARFDSEVSAPDKVLLWRWLEEDHDVSEVCQDYIGWDEFKQQALKLAERQRSTLRRTKPPGRPPQFPREFPRVTYGVEAELTPLEAKHAAALAPYLAKRAALLPEVRSFREEKLGRGTLEPVKDQIAAFLLRELGHLRGHKGEEDVEGALDQIPSYIDADEDAELMDLIGGYLNRGDESRERHWGENLSRCVAFDSMAWSYDPSGPFLYGLMHLIRDDTGRTLEDVGRLLTSRYPWPLRDAAWFVLTDEPPEIESLKIDRDSARGTHSITFVPWISKQTINSACHSALSRDTSPLRDKGLATFRFVNEHTEPGETPKWAELTRRWNELHPDDKFWDRAALRRAYKRAEERLASPWVDEQAGGQGSDSPRLYSRNVGASSPEASEELSMDDLFRFGA